MSTKDLQTRATRFVTALKRLRHEFRLQAGEYCTFCDGDVNLLASPLDATETPIRQHITLARGLMPPDEVQELPWGVFRGSELVATGLTNRAGQFIVDLKKGEYQLRFVANVEDREDVDVILRLNDPLFLPMVEDRLDDTETPQALKKYITECWTVTQKRPPRNLTVRFASSPTYSLHARSPDIGVSNGATLSQSHATARPEKSCGVVDKVHGFFRFICGSDDSQNKSVIIQVVDTATSTTFPSFVLAIDGGGVGICHLKQLVEQPSWSENFQVTYAFPDRSSGPINSSGASRKG